jgi:hypothetical protein
VGFPPIVLGKKERKRKKRNQKRKEGRNFHKWKKLGCGVAKYAL